MERIIIVSVKQIRDQLISILEAADPKNASSKSVKKWLGGQPPRSRWPDFPFGWVEWNGGPMEPTTISSKSKVTDNFYVVVVDKHPDETKAEDSVLEFSETVEAALDDDPTIGGLVAYSYVVNREKEKWFETDYSAAALRITLTTYRRE